MYNDGLSLDQAPPISVPFRFFFSAPIFAILIALIILSSDASLVMNRYSNLAIAIVHLFTLGILSMIIVGAMQQMMPVLAGAVIKKPLLFANVVHLSLVAGTLFFSIYFLFSGKEFLILGTVFLSIAFISFFIVSLRLLFKVKYLTSTVIAMRIFAILGLITILIGLHLAGAHIGDNIKESHYSLVSIHILFGMFGFALILIMGVAFQVIPMFYVAKPFTKFVQEKVPYLLSFLMFLYIAFELLGINDVILKLFFIYVIYSFANGAINSLNNRKRPIFDVTLLYWKLSLYSLIIFLFFWLFFSSKEYLLAILFGLGFLYSLLQGMIYKIIPFLCWFHLSSKGYFTVPTMRELIVEKDIRLQFYIYVSSFIFFVLASFLSSIFLYLAALLFIVSNILFLSNMILAIKRYKEVLKTDPMDMSAFQMPS